jgi:maleate cis-trans isomerase
LTRPLRLGVLTPSSNTALEPLTSALAAALPGCSAHFSRFRVTEIALDAAALGQFDDSKILAAAELLADAKVDVLRAAPLASDFERDHGIPLLDTVSTTVWGMVRAAGASPAAITGWGELFQWT